MMDRMSRAFRCLLLCAGVVILVNGSAMAGAPPQCPPPPPFSNPPITYVGLSSGCSNQPGGNPFCRVGEAIQFKFADGTVWCSTTYHWDFQDASVGDGATITHAFAAPGAFNVNLTVTSALSTSQVSQVVNVINGSVPTLGVWALLALLICVGVIGAFRLR